MAKKLKDREIPELQRQLTADSAKLEEAQEGVETVRYAFFPSLTLAVQAEGPDCQARQS